MDTSEVYIKMCEKATEIQKKWKPKGADFMFNTAVEECCFIRVERTQDRRYKDYYMDYNEDRFLWLPRQDQLQEMVKDWDTPSSMFITGVPGLFWSDETGYSKEDDKLFDYYSEFNSFEQLWLAFVMKEKYNKVWNGTDWITIGGHGSAS